MAAIIGDHEMKLSLSTKGMTMNSPFLRSVAASATALTLAGSASAVVAQDPLLSKTVNVKPNIALVLDTSGSMAWACVYAKHVTAALIKEGASLSGLTQNCLSSSDIRQASPVNNLLFYNPKKTYGPGYAGGVLVAPATVGTTSGIKLYLPIPPKDPTTYTTSNAIKDPANYDSYEVDAVNLKFKKNGANTAGNSNPFGTHGGSRTDCAADPCTFNEERQNIANWRAFHIDRIKAAQTGLSGAFTSQADNFRFAYADIYGNLNTMTDFGVNRSSFFSWLDGRAPSGNTPLRTALKKAGQYYQGSANTGPWGSKPWAPPAGETPADHLSCRRSYTLMITDGFYNDSAPSGIGDVDSTLGTKYTHDSDSTKTYQYTPSNTTDPRNKGKADKPGGAAGYSDTLADIALKYWATDLRSDLKNNNGRGDPSDPPFWQNMTSYMVSFGAPGSMTNADVASAKAGTLAWVAPVGDQITTIDDMRHAAHNGGGDFLTVTDAAQFSTDIGNVIGSIASQQFSQAGVAASAVTLTAGTKKFVPYYTTGSWWGNVQMIDLTATGASNGISWQVIATDANGQPTGVTTLPTPGSRNIVVWVDGTKQAVDFNFTNITAGVNNLKGTNTNMQMSNAVTSDIVNFLRGVRTKEGNGLRKRQAILGDIVNATPAFIKNNTNPQYEKLPVGTVGLSTYATYMADKAARTEGVLFVGANDGMLHAFGEGTGTKVGGRELFAYIPRSVLGKLEATTATGYTYAHTFTVDGPLSESDAYVTTPNLTTGGSSTGWRNLVLGTTGAGAKSVFALNASNPLGMNSKAVLWEINPDPAFPVLTGNTATSFQELGHVLSPVQSGITVSGDWVTVFGNGYDSKTGRASLFIVESGSGKLLKEITTDTTTGNGLGGVRLVLNSNQQIIGAYAGDLKGRLWKFDLSSTTSAGWGLGNGGAALFTALSGATPLPITAQPAVLERTDQVAYQPSYLVSVATGKLFEAGDPNVTTPTQAAYALWDRKPFGSSGTDTISATDLEGLTASTVTVGIDPTTGATINAGGITSFSTIGFSNPSVTKLDWTTRRGWKLDLNVYPGQRDIYPVQMMGEVVKIDTVAPQPATSSCQATSSNAMSFYINPLTGLCRSGGTLDTNADGLIDSTDANVCAYTSLADGMDVVLSIIDATGSDTGIRDIQNSSGDIHVRAFDPPPKPDCTNPAYAAANPSLCTTGCTNAAYAAANPTLCSSNCTSAAYRAANPGLCPGSTLNRSWRQLFPRAN
ncbi:MAG: PilC/PilY family type IV pilus protein [Rhodoferax sp.]|nr:PilC/PilY family type IV pilus protein [Rhodoferax sp.]